MPTGTAGVFDGGNQDPPVRDNDRRMSSAAAGAVHSAISHQLVSKMDRSELEDRYMRIYDENFILKKYARKQDERIKQMDTMQKRLTNDNKKLIQDPSGKRAASDTANSDEIIKQLLSKVTMLEKQRDTLKYKLAVMRQSQLPAVNQGTAYGHVPAQVDTGIPHLPVSERLRLARSMRVTGPNGTVPRRSRGSPTYQQSMRGLPDDSGQASADNKHLQTRLALLDSRVEEYERTIKELNEEMRRKEADYEQEIIQLRQKRGIDTRATISENTEQIRLQRDTKEKSAALTQLQAQYSSLEEKFRLLKGNNDRVLHEMDGLNQQLQYEQNKVLTLQNQLKDGKTSQRTLVEHQHRASDLENEVQILRQANEKLLASAFDMEKEREWRQRENALKVQIAQLEATLRADVGEKGGILDRLTEERDRHDNLETEHREMRLKFFELKQKYDELTDRMKYFSKDSAVDFTELDEALVIVRQRREAKQPELDFLQRVDEEQQKDVNKLLATLRAEHAETINELEKTRNMLIVQHKINKDYQLELEAVTKKMDENKREFDTRQDEYTGLLDIRAARIRKLELQMKDVAYGTRQYKLKPGETEPIEGVGSDEDEDHPVELELGQNMFEIHIKRLMLSDEGLRKMNDVEPNVFCTWEFYEFELQATTIQRGPKVDFEKTSQYIVTVDDFFLHYIQKDSCVLELHQSFGTDYQTVAVGRLHLKDILEQTGGRLHGTAQLTGVNDGDVGVNYGCVEYWVRLRVPMEQALRLYKERSKALGYLESNLLKSSAPPDVSAMSLNEATDALRAPDNINQLLVNIVNCSKVKSRRKDMQPNLFCVYKFFDFPDHDTQICPSSNSPQFDDKKIYPVGMTADFDKYLKSQPLKIYVFDDTDPDPTSLLGVATVPLIPLSHDKPIRGTFELIKKDGSHNGTVEISLTWQYTYMPPIGSASTRTQQMTNRGTGGFGGAGETMEPISLQHQGAMKHAGEGGGQGGEGGGYAPYQSSSSRPGSSKSKSSRPPSALPPGGGGSARGGSKGAGSRASQDELANPRRPSDVTTNQRPPSEQALRQRSPPLSSPPQRGSPDRPPGPSPATRGQSPQRAGPPHYSPPEEVAGRSVEVDESIVSEGSHVTGESEDMSEEMEITPRPDDDRTPTPGPTVSHLPTKSPTPQPRGSGGPKTLINSSADSKTSMSNRQERDPTDSEAQDSDIETSPSSRAPVASDIVKIVVNHVTLDRGCSLLVNDSIKMLFVEYSFLGVPLEETETPYSLPKPTVPDKPIVFNFSKVYDGQDERKRIGVLNVTVECLAALSAVQRQLGSLKP